MPNGKTKPKEPSTKEDGFFVYEEDKKDKPASSSSGNSLYTPKNIIYVYKDKSTTRVCYDPYSDIYTTVTIG